MNIEDNIKRRRTFAIISHPDAGKTTLTEKLLLYGRVINSAGSVKGKATSKYTISDWMEIEKERGISVTSSALQFQYDNYVINVLDTPGHQDFSEDTYRTLMAADSAVMVIDAAKGVEEQTRKLFKVCVARKIPIFTFVNKLDRDSPNTFDILDGIEKELGIATYPVNLPIGSGKEFKGVYDRLESNVNLYYDTYKGTKLGESVLSTLDEARSNNSISENDYELLNGELELLDVAGADLSKELVDKGELSPVFFGSALTNFGVEIFLKYFLKFTNPPLPRISNGEAVVPYERGFSAFVFKIQANMNKAHRDRIAFMRIVSGVFNASDEVLHVNQNKKLRLSQPRTMMADDRLKIDTAYAGDIIGVFDPGIFAIGDTVCDPKDPVCYSGIPTFAPENFARIRQTDTMKRKQFLAGINQLALEGAVQIFKEVNSGLEEIVVGVVGVLQLDVLKHRLNNEYNVEIILEGLPYRYIRRLESKEALDNLKGTLDMKIIEDFRGNIMLLFVNEWSVQMVLDRNEGLVLSEFSESIIN